MPHDLAGRDTERCGSAVAPDRLNKEMSGLRRFHRDLIVAGGEQRDHTFALASPIPWPATQLASYRASHVFQVGRWVEEDVEVTDERILSEGGEPVADD
jgi:hypothetical protein